MKGYNLYLGHIRFKGMIGDVKPSHVMAAIAKYTGHHSSQKTTQKVVEQTHVCVLSGGLHDASQGQTTGREGPLHAQHLHFVDHEPINSD